MNFLHALTDLKISKIKIRIRIRFGPTILLNKTPHKCVFIDLYILKFICISEPTGRPQVTVAHNTSSTSIYLEWTPPPTGSIHGEFQVDR